MSSNMHPWPSQLQNSQAPSQHEDAPLDAVQNAINMGHSGVGEGTNIQSQEQSYASIFAMGPAAQNGHAGLQHVGSSSLPPPSPAVAFSGHVAHAQGSNSHQALQHDLFHVPHSSYYSHAPQVATSHQAGAAPPLDNEDLDEEDPDEPPVALSNQHWAPLGPVNHTLIGFLWRWSRGAAGGYPATGGAVPTLKAVTDISRTTAQTPKRIDYSDLNGSSFDFQGLDWSALGVSRAKARQLRKQTYKNYTNVADSDMCHYSDRQLDNSENFYRFRRMDIRQHCHLAHFQLRSILAAAGRNQVFYPGRLAIYRHQPFTGYSEPFLTYDDDPIEVSSLDAKDGVLVAGTFTGEYCIRNLYREDENIEGIRGQVSEVNATSSNIINHLQIQEGRTSDSPLVAFASNDKTFQVMDLSTEVFVHQKRYPFHVNCTSLSPDRRLRALVGDTRNVVITSADTGDALLELDDHRDFGFACDWSGNGWTLATAAQDRTVKIWDARRWKDSQGKSTPVTTIRSDMTSVRGLRFSPIGSGSPVLAATEEADMVSLIDARRFDRKQTIDVFGEIGGVAFSGEGHDLHVLCCDPSRGGLLQLERCSYGTSSDIDSDDFDSRPTRFKPRPAARALRLDRATVAGVSDATSTEKVASVKGRMLLHGIEPF